jgi:hypothetical protein
MSLTACTESDPAGTKSSAKNAAGASIMPSDETAGTRLIAPVAKKIPFEMIAFGDKRICSRISQ